MRRARGAREARTHCRSWRAFRAVSARAYRCGERALFRDPTQALEVAQRQPPRPRPCVQRRAQRRSAPLRARAMVPHLRAVRLALDNVARPSEPDRQRPAEVCEPQQRAEIEPLPNVRQLVLERRGMRPRSELAHGWVDARPNRDPRSSRPRCERAQPPRARGVDRGARSGGE